MIPVNVSYRGSAAATASLKSGGARPLGLAAGDFDGDGYPDVVSAYDGNSGGVLAIHYGSAAGFRAEAFTLDAPERPDFVAAGDFNADDRCDVVLAARGSDRLYFLPGDGKGGFGLPETIPVGGRITAFASGEINRRDGLADLVVAVASADGARLLVFQSRRGALRDKPEIIGLTTPANALALRVSNENGFGDILVRGEDGVQAVRGHDRKRGDNPPNVQAARAEEFPSQAPADGVVASLAVPFSGGGAAGMVELHADSVLLQQSQNAIGGGFVVNNSGNAGDGDVTDGICDTGNHVAGFTGICTLNAAIQQANFNNVATTITFDPSVVTITPGNVLPNVTVPITVDGLTGRTARVQLDGRNATGGDQIFDPSGLGIYGGGSTVTGMTIFGFSAGIKTALQGHNTIQNCLIGVDNTGAVPSGRKLTYGVLLEVSSPFNLIGGTATGQGNVISTGNPNGTGIAIQSASNTVQGNLVGTDPAGAILIGNGNPILITDSSSNTIGGATAGVRNVVAGMTGTANANVAIHSSNAFSDSTLVQGNFIGTDLTGTLALGGSNGGVFAGGRFTMVGGATPAARNLISGNGAYGVLLDHTGDVLEGNYIGTDVTGAVALANGCCGVQVQISGAQVENNLISGNNGPGITINQSFTSNVQVTGNLIGLNAAGTAALGNTGDGIAVVDISGSGHIFGMAGAGNVISGNGGNGINTAEGAVTVQGNFIGTNLAGNAAIPNSKDGIAINAGFSGTLVGGSGPGQGNVVSGNSGNGVTITASNPFTVQGNLIGTDATGTNPLGNGKNGLFVGAGFIIGNCGSCSSYFGTITGNTLANNGTAGVDLDSAFYNTLRGNSIFANPTAGIVSANGSNFGIQPPVLNSATLMGGTLQVQGSVPNAPLGLPATLEFFDNHSTDSPAEGRKSLGTASVNATGAFQVQLNASAASILTATVTDQQGNTSAFSNGVAVVAPCTPNVSGQVSVTRGPIGYNAGLHAFVQIDTLTNTSGSAIAAPIYLVIDNLSSVAHLANASGTTSCNTPASPYITVMSSGSLAPGASVKTPSMQFSDPTLAGFTYTTRVLAGQGQQ